MIVIQYPYIDEHGNERENLIKTYSDLGLRIRQNETGEIYDEAVDAYRSEYTYSETDEYIVAEDAEDEEIDYKTAYNNLAAEVLGDETTE